MPIEPIDLQVLFSRMVDVGKGEAVRNDLVNVAQSLQASELVQRAETRSSSVNETNESEEIERLRGQEQRRSGSGAAEQGEERKGGAKKRLRKPSFQDPDLGRNVDISG